MDNKTVARMLREIADMVEIKGETIYKRVAYQRAAENIETLGQDIREIWKAGKLREIPGIGVAIEKKLDELFRTGRMEYYDRLQEEIPAGVVSLLAIPGIGPKTAKLLWERLGLLSVADVERAAREGLLRQLPGLGERSEQRILEGIESLHRRSDRVPLGIAWPVAAEVMAALEAAVHPLRMETAGSLRRMRETIGDIDLLAAAEDTAKMTEAFVHLPFVAEIILQGPTKATVVLENGLQTDLRVLEPARWGTALQYFTGSQSHNVALRELALRQGWSLSEYGLKSEQEEILCAEEDKVYQRLGLAWIPPELRENHGEIQAAREGMLPKLVQWSDLAGDLHIHTRWSDGAATVAEMAEKAASLGYRYIVISDHTQSLGIANGLNWERFQAQRQEIAEAQARFPSLHILQGAEVEIRADGTLDLPDEFLEQLDIVIASLHSGLRQEEAFITDRAIRAMRNPHVDILGHPSGRLLGQREASSINLDHIIQAAAETGTILEINSIPNRLDLDDVHIRQAIKAGVKLAINSDAHSTSGLENIRYGVATARRGWAEKKDIVNTWPLEELRKLIEAKHLPRS